MHGDDLRFVSDFDGGRVPPERFGHHEFLRLAWVLLERAAIDVATPALRHRLRAYAARHALADGYHETRTIFYLREIARRRRDGPACDSFAAFARHHAELLEPSFVEGHYPPGVLDGGQARDEWVPPPRRAVGAPATARPAR